MKDIFCNPMQLPDLGQGVFCRDENNPINKFLPRKRVEFREVADPEGIFYQGKWYLFPSVQQAYVSEDFIHWEFHPIEIDGPLGYAPCIVHCNGRFLLTASPVDESVIYASSDPLGPYHRLGNPVCPDGTVVRYLTDPAWFLDDDGRLYLFWGVDTSGADGIFGMEMDPENPCRGIKEPVRVIGFCGENYWERYGEYNEHLHYGWTEGVSLYKHNGVYLLHYSACGTNLRNYSLACYRSSVSPLGPYLPPTRPMIRSPHGMVTGTGHGGMIKGPDGEPWQLYSCLIRRLHNCERRIGADRVEFDANGEPYVNATSVPQSIRSGSLGLTPVTVGKPVDFSSCRHEHFGSFAVDDCTPTWWDPAEDDMAPYIEVDLREVFDLHSARMIWTEPELDYAAGKLPEPVRFEITFYDAEHQCCGTKIDYSENTVDHNVEFVIFPEGIRAQYVRLTVLRSKNLYHHGVTDFTVFGYPGGSKK
ncbi:MAG: family 43 glycosylhydrolase [Lentisphaeria bacterium]|nr:family 43 glycosylhydrolase [Lentisphaeria bacterium]